VSRSVTTAASAGRPRRDVGPRVLPCARAPPVGRSYSRFARRDNRVERVHATDQSCHRRAEGVGDGEQAAERHLSVAVFDVGQVGQREPAFLSQFRQAEVFGGSLLPDPRTQQLLAGAQAMVSVHGAMVGVAGWQW
jgi:hypothetical protein